MRRLGGSPGMEVEEEIGDDGPWRRKGGEIEGRKMIGNGGWEVHRRWRWSGRSGKMVRGGGREVEVVVGDGGPWRRKVVEEEDGRRKVERVQ